MKVVIIDDGEIETHYCQVLYSIRRYEANCFGNMTEVCDYCPFRFRCFTERDSFEVRVGELDDLSLRFIAREELLELVHRRNDDQSYYKSLFYKITKEKDMDRGYISLLAPVAELEQRS